jgi:hypothetical protein
MPIYGGIKLNTLNLYLCGAVERPRGGSNSQPTDSKNRPVESMPYMWGYRVYKIAYMGVKNVQEVHFWH